MPPSDRRHLYYLAFDELDAVVFTEDAGLFFHYAGEPVRILPGSDENIKITVPTDTVTAEAIYADLIGRGS
jgi:2-C-methyl-D-erythritol 4-phosphate cytidylyltransferase